MVHVATKCLECQTPTILLSATKQCGASEPDIDKCPFAVRPKQFVPEAPRFIRPIRPKAS